MPDKWAQYAVQDQSQPTDKWAQYAVSPPTVPDNGGRGADTMRAAPPIDYGFTGHSPDDPTQSLGRRAINWVSNVGAAGMGVIGSMLPNHDVDRDAPFDPSTLLGPGGPGIVHGAKSMYDLVTHAPETYRSLYASKPADTTSELVGMAGGGAALDPEAIAGGLDTVGGGLKAAGGGVSDATALGSTAMDRRFGASPGRGLSENRIVGTTPASLKAKVDAKAPQIVADRASILDRSQAPPTNIRQDVDQPFADLSAKVLHPKTGVADPAEVRALTQARATAHFQQDPLTGRPLVVDEQPVPRNLESMSPAEIAEYNSNLRDMGNYTANTSPLADQAIKGAGHNLRQRLGEVAPESQDLTRQLYNTETASDILGRKMQGGEPTLSPSTTLTGLIGSRLLKPAISGLGTAAGAGMDAIGSGLQSMARRMSLEHPPGPPPAGATALDLRPPQPSGPAGSQSPLPSEPQAVAPPPTPAQLPGTAGMSVAMPHPQAPPNVGLRERVGESALGPRPGQPAPAPGVGGVQGPEGRVTTRTPYGFGPKVEAPAFTIPPKQLTTGGANALQEPSTSSLLQRSGAQGNAGGEGGGRGGVEPGKQGQSLTEKISGQKPGGEPHEGGTLSSKVALKKNPPLEEYEPPEGASASHRMNPLLQQFAAPAEGPKFDPVGKLVKQYSLPESIAQNIVDADPSLDKRYIKWMAQSSLREDLRFPEDTQQIRNALQVFDRVRNSNEFAGSRDIQQYRPHNLYDMVQKPETLTLSKKAQRAELLEKGGPGAELILHDGDAKLFRVTDPEKACILGSNTHWCTTNQLVAEYYINGGQSVADINKDPNAIIKPLYIVYDGDKPTAQFHPGTSQLRDPNDQSIADIVQTPIRKAIEDATERGYTSQQGQKLSLYNKVVGAKDINELSTITRGTKISDLNSIASIAKKYDPPAATLVQQLLDQRRKSAELTGKLSRVDAKNITNPETIHNLITNPDTSRQTIRGLLENPNVPEKTWDAIAERPALLSASGEVNVNGGPHSGYTVNVADPILANKSVPERLMLQFFKEFGKSTGGTFQFPVRWTKALDKANPADVWDAIHTSGSDPLNMVMASRGGHHIGYITKFLKKVSNRDTITSIISSIKDTGRMLVSRPEFLEAFEKNPNLTTADRRVALDNIIDVYNSEYRKGVEAEEGLLINPRGFPGYYAGAWSAKNMSANPFIKDFTNIINRFGGRVINPFDGYTFKELCEMPQQQRVDMLHNAKDAGASVRPGAYDE